MFFGNLKTLLVLVLLISVFGCNDKEVKSVVTEWQNKQVKLPNIRFAKNVHFNNPNKVLSKKYKVLTLIDGDCGSCIEELKIWKNFMKEVDTSRIGFIYNIYSNERLETFKLLDSLYINLEHLYFQDDLKKYIRKNKFPRNKDYQTFLLDRNNRILLIGNPIYNDKIKDLYLKKMIE